MKLTILPTLREYGYSQLNTATRQEHLTNLLNSYKVKIEGCRIFPNNKARAIAAVSTEAIASSSNKNQQN
ncbi:hypothetical protein [Cyanothece sp. BG0011]|uniref:hypothetical protein n=1 Tax=Cyanothece sp. BG0011 TaxID=2082950 RepID=UPI001300539C|nr:hypothetical protein [Cyanothece sp. BG0011]